MLTSQAQLFNKSVINNLTRVFLFIDIYLQNLMCTWPDQLHSKQFRYS